MLVKPALGNAEKQPQQGEELGLKSWGSTCLRSRHQVIGDEEYWAGGRVVASGIRSRRALTTGTGDVFCLERNEKPLGNLKLVDGMVSSWTYSAHPWFQHRRDTRHVLTAVTLSFHPHTRPVWWLLRKEILPDLVWGRTGGLLGFSAPWGRL